MITSHIGGYPVIWSCEFDLPRYLAAGVFEKIISAVVISIVDEGSDDQRFVVTYVGESGELEVAGIFASLAEAKRAPIETLGRDGITWSPTR